MSREELVEQIAERLLRTWAGDDFDERDEPLWPTADADDWRNVAREVIRMMEWARREAVQGCEYLGEGACADNTDCAVSCIADLNAPLTLPPADWQP